MDPVPQSKEKLCHVCGSEKHETKDWEPKKNIYVTDQNNIQQIIINTGSKQITLTIIQKRKIKDTRNMWKKKTPGNKDMLCMWIKRTSNKTMQKEHQPICHQQRMPRYIRRRVEIFIVWVWKGK